MIKWNQIGKKQSGNMSSEELKKKATKELKKSKANRN